jgi:hypothetical protein
MDPAAIIAVAKVIFSQESLAPVRVEEVYAQVTTIDEPLIDEVIYGLSDRKLVQISLDHRTVHPRLPGKDGYEANCLPELVLGHRYIREKYSAAVVHIIVQGLDGESGASGFFSADYEGCIITASHVAENREVLRVEDRDGRVIAERPQGTIAGPTGPDIAVIPCPLPGGVTPLRIEWQKERIQPLDEVLVLGYPRVPNHRPALFHATAEVHSIAMDFRGRDKIILSSVTHSGCSGGPLISERGLVVGVVEQENIADAARPIGSFFSATMARDVSELF